MGNFMDHICNEVDKLIKRRIGILVSYLRASICINKI
jgi:hypothetical protein